MHKTYLIIIFFIFNSCSNQSKEIVEIKNLISLSEKEAYLQNLFKDDQKLRILESEVLLKYGYESKEHIKLWQEINIMDSINYLKTKLFLKEYGYTECKMCSGIIYIVGHQNQFQKQKEIFPYFNSAFIDGKIRDKEFLFLLGEMYERLNGYRYKFDTPKTHNESIEILKQELNLFE